MRLNTLKPSAGSKRGKKRLGRGCGSGLGKTGGRGVKGQSSRSGTGKNSPGFEGGQMPLHKRLPKFGFTSRTARYTAEIRLDQLNKIEADVIDLAALMLANIIPYTMKRAKVINTGTLNKAVTLKGIAATQGARAAITQAGGKIEE
ncbi:MAG: 50S ribosomal protein L15 [Gammaproteobacteria bacterium]